MIQIRKGVYETNSSSSHSIVMLKEDKHETEMIDPDWHLDNKGKIIFWNEEDLSFGRSPFELLTDWYGRLRYVMASCGRDEAKFDEIKEICYRRVAGCTGFRFPKDRWNNTEYRGDIDHQSWGLLPAALSKFSISLEDFIFNDRYIVVVDGDEYCVFDTFVKSGMFNEDAVKDIVSASDQLEDMYNEESVEE